MGHSIKPRPERLSYPDRAGLIDQNKKRRLERVFGVVRVAKHRPADARTIEPWRSTIVTNASSAA